MQYISPLRYVELSAADTIDRKDLLLAKKKMLAELELNDGRGIEINGKDVSKNDIVRFFDDLQQSADLSYHFEVYKDKALLDFLEHNALGRQSRFASNPVYADESFITWISPYYAHSFSTLAIQCLSSLMDDTWSALLSNPLMMNSYHTETVWEDMERKIRNDISKIEYAEESRVTRDSMAEVGDICGFKYVCMLGLLPETRFALVRDEMAFAMMQLCIKIFNHVDREWPIIIIQNAHVLAVSEQMKNQIDGKRIEMETIEKNNKRSFWRPRLQWNNGRMVFFFLFVIFKVITCGISHSSNDNIRYIPAVQYQPADSSFRSFQQRIKNLDNDTSALITAPNKAAVYDSMRRLVEKIQKMKASGKPMTDSEVKKAMHDLLHNPSAEAEP